MNYSYVVNIVKQSSQPFWLVGWWLFFSHDYRIVPSADWKGGGAQGMTANLVKAWNLQCFFNRRQKRFTLLSPASRDVRVVLVDDSRDWLHDDNSWYSIFGAVLCTWTQGLCVCCSDGLALALKCWNKYASVTAWYWPPGNGLCDSRLPMAKTCGYRVFCSCRLHKCTCPIALSRLILTSVIDRT